MPSFISYLSGKELKAETALKAEGAAADKLHMIKHTALLVAVFSFFIYPACLISQDVPEDELDVRINTYFDNFRVNVFYPEITISKKIGENTSISGRYLTDIISAASMKANFQYDGLTTATPKKIGGGDNTPDEWRHDLGTGITQ